MAQKLIIHTDGGARGNPGEAAIGVYIQAEIPGGGKETLAKLSQRIGITTNNVAEYRAVIYALEYLKANKTSFGAASFYLDSLLVVKQLVGEYKIKKSHLRELYVKILSLLNDVGGTVSFYAVPRSQNTEADFLVNQALDSIK